MTRDEITSDPLKEIEREASARDAAGSSRPTKSPRCELFMSKASSFTSIKLRYETVERLDKFLQSLAEDDSYMKGGEERNAKGHLIRRDGVTRDDAVTELLRRAEEKRERSRKFPGKRKKSRPPRPRIPAASPNATNGHSATIIPLSEAG